MRAYDRERMLDLLLTYRGAGYVLRYPTVWRVKLLLDSRVWDVERDICLWQDDSGQLIACGFLWKRRTDSVYYALERILHPTLTTPDISEAVLDWALNRITTEAEETQRKLFVAVFPQEQDRAHDIQLLESKGFLYNPESYNVYMSVALDKIPAVPELPLGFQLQPLVEADLELYQQTYGFTPVTIDHQRALLHNPEYQHFVIKAPDGVFAAYLECSFSREEWARHQQRVGWIDYIQTQPQFLRHGLGQALMLKSFEYLRTQGANMAMLITSAENDSAQALFCKVGMALDGNDYVYSQEMTSSIQA